MGAIGTAFDIHSRERLGAAGDLELVRAIVAPWRRGDFRASAWADPEIEFVLADGPSPGRWSGIADTWCAFTDVLAPWADYRVIAEDIRSIGDGRVLVLHRYGGVAKTSGMEIAAIAAKGADVFEIRDGLVRRLTIYWQSANALSDLGIAAAVPHRRAPRRHRAQSRDTRAGRSTRRLAAVPESRR